MSVFVKHPGLRWLVPAGIAAAVIGAGSVTKAITASADSGLPERTAAQLLVDLQMARVDGLSGTIVQRADLGLPALPGIGEARSSGDLTTLLSGSHTLRAWYSGPDKARVAVLDTFGETDFIADGTTGWVWNSQENTATRMTLPKKDARGDTNGGQARRTAPAPVPTTPKDLADLALRALEPSTTVSTAGTARVAGRSAYELALVPKDTSSLVGQVRIAIDGKQHVPLRAQVFPKGSDKPVLEAAFTQVDFNRPDDAQFRFNPPAGAKIVDGPEGTTVPTSPLAIATASGTTTVGSGWTTVFATRLALPSAPAGGSGTTAEEQAAESLFSLLPKVSGTWGSGRALSGKLFSVLLTDDGRLLAGLVPVDRLTQALSDPALAALGTR